jgi:hypothetical protein
VPFQNYLNIFSYLLLVLPTYQAVHKACKIYSKHSTKISLYLIVHDTTHAYMHYNIRSISSYTNESLLVPSLPPRQTGFYGKMCQSLRNTLVYRLCLTLYAGFMQCIGENFGGGSLPTRQSSDRAIRKRDTWYLTIAILIVGLDTIIKIQES